jgi:hypothetical protein
MPNIRVKQAVERIAKELRQVRKHIEMYSGVDAKDARAVDRLALDIIDDAHRISDAASSWFSGEDEPD